MAPISLKIISNDGAVTRKMKFDLKSTVRDAHALLKEKVIVPDQTKEHGLFLRSPDDDRSGIWLENHRTLDYYMLRDGDSLDYICKIRNLRIKLLDGTVKTIQVNEGKTIAELMVSICGRLNIANHDEHGLCPEEEEPTEDVKEAPQTGTLTLKRRKAAPRERDAALEQLSKKINTDDNVHWLDQHSTLRELGVAPTATLVLKRRLFFSDRNVDARDPVQLTLLYAQTRDAILAGRHLVTEEQAVEFAGIQCQIHYEDFQEEKHKPGFIENLNEFLPVTYSGSWGIEKKVLRAYRKHAGLSPLEAKNLYIKTARDLPTYGVTFFLVKEKQKGKKKLVPRLLGINAQAILRMDEVTKEILQQWPLTHVKNYHVGKSETFTLNFGDYSDKEYCCKTQDVHRIREILEGYIDLIRRRMLAKPTSDAGDSMAICHDMVEAGQSNIIQHVQNQASKLISETFVGPSRIMTHDQGSTAQRGTQVMTMQQIIASNQFNNPQKAIKGEVAQRGEMSLSCVRKLKRMNSCSVKIVTLLAEPTEANISDTQQLTKNMQDDLVVVEMGVKEIAQQQTIEESRQMLLNEMQDLNNHMNKLSDAVTPGQVDANEAKDAAEKIVDLTTEMYLAQDPKTKRRSELLNRSKNRFIAGEKMDDSIRRASFLTAASSAIGGLDRAAATLAEEYGGAAPDEARARHAELALQDRLGKLNAALALYLTAHSDPNNIDYPAAITSMNTIDQLLSDLAKEGQLLASTKSPEDRKELLDDLRALIDKTRDLCSLTGVDDHAKMQEASSKYADVAGKLIFKLFRGGNSQKENEIIELARAAGDKTNLLLMSINELTAQAPAEPAAALDTAGVRSAAAAMDLLACAQLTAPAIYEPHCRSALTAAVEGLSSSVHHLSTAWKPLVEDPGRQYFSEQLHHREMDVHLALEKLKDGYANLGDLEDESVPLEERQRLKFILSLSGAKDNLKGLTSNWGKSDAASPAVEGPPGAGPKGVMMLELKEKAAARRLAQQLAELNGAVARLTNATADPKQQDYVTAASALNTIAELMPTVVQDAGVVCARQDEGTRAAMKQHVTRLCEASQHLVDNLSSLDDLGPPAAKFSGACSKLVFLISPGADKGKEQTINEVAAAAYDSSAALLAHAHRLASQRGGDAAALRAAAARAELAARALVTAAQVTAPSVNEASCSSALAAAVQHLQNCTNDVTANCYLHLKPGSKESEELQKSRKQLENNLERLAQLCGLNLTDQDIEMGEPSGQDAALLPQQENRRLQFIKSMSDAKTRLDEAEQQMKEPLACVMMRAEDAAVLQRRLVERLARLNAAVASLARASADGENPDYDATQQAVDTITELMPELVQETCVLGATKSANSQQNMLQQLQRLCRAARPLCDCAPGAGGVEKATAELSDASGKLVFLMSPGTDHGKENEIKALTSEACGRASELLSQVQDLIQKVPEEKGAELDKRGARTTDDAQVLLTTAELTAPTIAAPHCSAALVSAAEQLRGSAQDLTRACQPHLQTGHKEQQGLQDSAQHLENSLDKLIQACKERRKPPAPPQQDKQRLHFVNSLSGAKSCFDDAQQLLDKPVVCAMMREEDGVALERTLADRLAQLNVAIAALATATADREQPDYASAQRAVSTITALMPELVRESRTLCGTKTDDAQQHLLQQVQQLCDASRAVCDSAGQPQALSEAAAKFSDVSGKLMFTLTPAPGQGKDKQLQGPEQQQKLQASHETPPRKPPAPPQQDKQRLHFVNSLSGAKSCFDDAQQLLDKPVVCAMMREEDGVALERTLADRLAQLNVAIAALATATADREQPDYASAQRAVSTITALMPELVRESRTLCGTKTDNAQQHLLQQVQQLCDASRAVCDSAGQPQALSEAAAKFSDVSGKLMFTLTPAPGQGKDKQGPEQQQKLQARHETPRRKPPAPPQQDKQRLHFVNSLSGAKSCFDDVQQLLKQPVVCAMMREGDGVALERTLADRLAQLNAAIAALATATADREHPDYASAQRAINTITTLMPELVRDSKSLCGTKTDDAQQKLLRQVQQLCDASRAVCDSAQQPQALNEAATKFADASGQLMFTFSPAPVQGKEKQIMDLSAESYNRTAELVSQAQALQGQLNRDVTSHLDSCSTRTGDAARALLAVAQVTAPSMSSPHCQAALDSAVQKLRRSAAELTGACDPHVKQSPQRQQLFDTHQHLDDSLDRLLHASGVPIVFIPEEQEKRRLTFVDSLAGAKSCFGNVQQQLKQPVVSITLQPEEHRALQLRLSDRLAQLNAAIAKLASATADREHPDYASAQRAVSTITALMPELVRDSKTLCATQQGPAQQNMLRQVQQLCDASRAVCDSTGTPQGLTEAAMKFSEASSELTSSVATGATQGTQQQIIELSAVSVGRASELLSQVQALTQQIAGPAATELDRRGARTADAAQALLTVAQVTAPSMSSPQCKAALETAVQNLRGSAANLTTACDPHVKQGPQRQQLLDSHQHLDDSLDMLLEASGVPVVLSPEQQEKRRRTFINSLAGAKSCFEDVQQQLKQPVVSITLRPEEHCALQLRLSDRLAQLNAAIAKLTSATADREQPDYASAQRAVSIITALMPELVRDAKTISATQQGPAQQSILQQVQQLCDASRAVCDSTGTPQGLSEAAAKFSEASSELTSSVATGATQGTQQQIIELSAVSVGRASELLSQVQALTQQIAGPAATELDRRGARTADAAQALLTVAQVTAPSMSSPQCKAALESAVRNLRGSAADLTTACDPHVKQGPQRQQLLDSHQHLDDSLDMLLETSGVPVVLSPEQQEKRRRTFINSLAGAKSCFEDVQQQLKQPVVSITLRPEEHCALQLRLSDRLAQLNAAIAKLTSATADREHPDYASAQRAVSTITALMPELVRDAKTISATQQGPAQQNMLRQVQQLCDASRAVCDSTGTPQGLREAAAKFSEVSNELRSSVGTGATQGIQQQIIELSAVSVGSASELLSQVQALTQQIVGPAATELDRRGARTADAAQALLTVAQVTAPSMSSSHCQAALDSAVQKLRGSAADLTGTCDPHVKQGPQRQQLLDTHQHLDDSLDTLLEASGVPVIFSPEKQEKRRLTFFNSLAEAKSCFGDVQQQLKEPVVASTLPQEEVRSLQRQLGDRLARLNAAVASLAASSADHEHPDYASAQRAVSTITALMPELVRDAKILSATQQGPAQQSLLRQVQQLCDASRAVCDSAGLPQGLGETAVKFSEASNKLTSSITLAGVVLGKGGRQERQQQLVDLSAKSCACASELLSQVQALTQQIAGPAATELDRRGAKTADAAQALLTVAHVTASCIRSPHCRKVLDSAVQRLRGSAADLTSACDPHVEQGSQRQQLLDTHQHLDDSLDLLLQASGAKLSPEKLEKQRQHFISNLSEARNCFDDVQQQLKQPTAPSTPQPEELRALQFRLSDKLAQLNAAIAKLTVATGDREQPDYASAQRAVSTITVLMPELMRDAKTLSGTKQGPAQQSLLQQVQQLCDASRAVCNSAQQPQDLSKAATQFSEASNHLMSTVSSVDDHGKEKLIMDLSAASCSRASELVSQAQPERGQLRADVTKQLDSCSTRTDDAVQALKAVVQVTASSMSSPECQAALESAVQALRDSASELAGTCDPHLEPGRERQQLLDAHRHLDDSLDLLMQASVSGDERSPALQEALRIKFIRCVFAISPHVKDTEKLLNEQAQGGAPPTQAQTGALQQQLGRRLQHLRAAGAALAAASRDHKYPDYAAAERSIITITELMPKVVRESKTLSCTKSDDCQQMIRQNLKELCDASRQIVDNADDPKKLNESSAKFAVASGKLVQLVAPDGGDGGKRKGPPVPQRAAPKPDGHSTKTVAHGVPYRNSTISQDFLDAMRAQEDNENAARVVAAETKWGVLSQTDEEKCRRRQFSDTVDTVEDEIKFVEDIIKKIHSTAPRAVDALELVRVEQRAEEALARAGVDVAALVAANYADKLDYSAAQEPTLGLGRTLRAIVEDGCTISGALPEESRKPFINDMSGLCGATRILCQAARDEKERLNDAAVAFGNHSARLLQVVSAQVNPALEKEVIHRARAIGDCASRLAREATNVANNSANMQDSKSGDHVQSICTAGAQCVDAAGKLVYTAKLVAPTIHHKTCQEALTSSADTLSSNLKTFSDTWQPFASDPHTQKLTKESRKLARLLATLKADVERGRLGKRREGERPVVVDTPLRQLTVQIIDNARNMAEHGDLPPEAKEEYRNYCSKLTAAVRALDYSNARCQRAPHDKNRRNEMEIAIQDLQMMLLQARPARAGQEHNNIVDFRDFLQGLVTESDNLARAVDKNKAITGKRTADDIKLLCSKISEDSTRLMNPSQSAACDGFDDIMEIDEFAQECGLLVRELAGLARGAPAPASGELLARLFPLTENCNLLRFAASSALSTGEAAAHDAALLDLDDFRAGLLRALRRHRRHRLRDHEEARGAGAGAGAWGVLRAALALCAAAGRPPALRRALTSYALHAATRPRARHARDVMAPPHHARRVTSEERVVAYTVNETEKGATHANIEKIFTAVTDLMSSAEPGASSGHSRIKRAAAERSLTEEELEQQIISSSEEVEETDDKSEEPAMYKHLEDIAREVQESMEASALLAANWLKPDRSATVNLIKKVSWNIQEITKNSNAVNSKPAEEVLKEEDIEKLLSCQSPKVEGTRSQLEDKLARLSATLGAAGASVLAGVRAPAAAARSLRAAAGAAAELAAAARALRDDKKPAQSKRIEDAVHEMCLATFSLMKISELLCQFPDHHDTRRRLLDACYHLNDCINKLNRTVHPEPRLARECSELLGALQLQRSALQAAPLPAAASPYAHCLDALQSQREVLLKLNSDEAMSREQFLRSMMYVTTAVTNSTECAAQAAYLLSVSEKDTTVALEGLVDVPKMQKTISAIHDTCVSVTMNTIDQVIEEKRILEKQIEELLKDMDESFEKIKDQELKTTLVMCRKDIEDSAKSFYRVVNEKKLSDEIISAVLTLDDDILQLSGALEQPALVPAPARPALGADVLQHSTALVSETQELIKDIKNSSEQSEVMKWSSFAKRKDVLSAIDTLIKSIKTNGQNVNILEADLEDSENKSYVQIQTDTAFKWLHKPMAKSDVKANGQQAVKNLIEVGRKMTEDLAGADKEDLRHAVDETEQLLAHCSRKYDQDQYSLLMERIRELQKAIERMAVTRVVEDFMDAEEPLADLDILADAETDATKRKFLLEQKIAELLAQLARVKRTASYIADTGSNGAKVSTELRTCSEQTELLAPLLVKAAEERIHKSENQMVIDNYRALLAQYTEALAKVRDLCDQSVDPMDFVQTAGETMQRMRDESINQDVMKCAYTSAAITKLANRVIHVGLSSSGARADPDLQRALVGAQRQLSAATPAPDTRASKMPDWKDTTALILRATGEVESVLGGENIFNKQPDTNEPIYNEALNLHVAIRDWSSRDNEIVAVARRMAVLMAKLSSYMHADKQREVLATSKSIVRESREVARLARKLAHECPDRRIKSNLLQVCDRIPTISGQLKMLTTIKGSSLGHHGTQEDKEAMDMLVGNAQGLMISIQDVVKAAASASVKIMSQRGPRIKWVRRTYY